MLWGFSETTVLVATFAVFLAAIEIGFRLGSRYSKDRDDSMASHASALQSAVLGLLALLLGFTFAMSISRFDERKKLVISEANAIGTAFLRAEILDPKEKNEAQSLLRQYVDARLDFYHAGTDKVRIDESNNHAEHIEADLWQLAMLSARKSDKPATTNLFIQSLNEVIDLKEERQAALENHVPETVIDLLFFVVAVGMGFIGYNYGLTGKRRHGSTMVFALLITIVLTVIIDIDRPRRGLITVSQASLERLKSDISKK